MKNFLQGRASLKSVVASSDNSDSAKKPGQKNALGPLNGGQTSSDTGQNSDSDIMPEVQVVSENDRVQRIIVTCTCGKCIELECQY